MLEMLCAYKATTLKSHLPKPQALGWVSSFWITIEKKLSLTVSFVTVLEDLSVRNVHLFFFASIVNKKVNCEK